MSEYQYYEFQAIDRLLSPDEIRVLRSHSSRARITPSSFVNEYSFGSFKGNEDEWMATYFDAFLYVANWGARTLMLRLPSSVLSESASRPYCSGDERYEESLTARAVQEHVILKFGSHDQEGGEWIDGAGLLGSLLPIRSELAQGDHRALYLGWLRGIQKGSQRPGLPEPPVPPGLRSLSPSLDALASFLEIDRDLISAAAAASADLEPVDANPAAAAEWIAGLPSAEKDALLLRLMQGHAVHTGMELRARFERQRTATMPPKLPASRTVGQLLDAAKSVRQIREREAARRAAEELAKSEREERAARAQRLDALSLKVPQTWNEVEALVSVTQRVAYAEAARLLVDLREIAARNQAEPEFLRRFGALCDRHARKKALMDLLTERGLRS
jgi:hypothetical protein